MLLYDDDDYTSNSSSPSSSSTLKSSSLSDDMIVLFPHTKQLNINFLDDNLVSCEEINMNSSCFNL